MSFTDKLSNGLAVYAFQQVLETLQEAGQDESSYIREVMCVWPAAAAAVGVVQTYIMYRVMKFKPRHCHGEPSATLPEERAIPAQPTEKTPLVVTRRMSESEVFI